jgi:hypothetical protein
MKNFEETIISQFANSPTICGLVTQMNEWIRPDADIDNFYNFVFNVATAEGFGLDIWGRIVGVNRIDFPIDGLVMNDDQYRELVMLKALSNISASTIPSINQLLRNWMVGRGKCYCTDLGSMEMGYVFEFQLEPWELTIITQSGIFLRPQGVGARVIASDFPVFGFKGMTTAYAAPFGQAPFIAENATHAVI